MNDVIKFNFFNPKLDNVYKTKSFQLKLNNLTCLGLTRIAFDELLFDIGFGTEDSLVSPDVEVELFSSNLNKSEAALHASSRVS